MKILFATDHSQYSKEAAWLLSRLPFATPPEITLLNVLHMPSMPASVGMHPMWAKAVETMEKEADEELQTVADSFRGTLSETTTVVRRGEPSEEILREAEACGAELIVVGAVGHGTFERNVLGSVSDRVATHAKCSVLVVRPSGLATQSDRHLRVLVPCDYSEDTEAVIDRLSGMSWGGNVEIHLLHVLEYVQEFHADLAMVADGLWEREERESKAKIHKLADRMEKTDAEIRVRHVSAPHAGTEIRRVAEQVKADLIVMGDRGHGAVKRFLLGSTSRHVLRKSDASVWINRRTKG